MVRNKDIANEFDISTILKGMDECLMVVEEASFLPQRKTFKASSFPEIEQEKTAQFVNNFANTF